MAQTTALGSITVVLLITLSCSSGGNSDDAGDAGAGSGGVGGRAFSDGGTAGDGGKAATTGAAGGGGQAGGGGVGAAAGAMASGGTGGAGSGTGGMGGASAAEPSAGCAKGTGRPAGGVVAVAQNYSFTFPATYDGKTPFPVFIGFHGCGAGNRGTETSNTEWISLSKGTAFETQYVRAVPVSSDAGGCWNYANDIPRVTKMFDELLANHCVDTSRVFATGHSSGAQLLVQILTDKHVADAQHFGFAGVAPVAASDYGVIKGPIPVMYIQGKMDKERSNGDGHEAVARFTAANTCGATSAAYTQVVACKSQAGGGQVNPGCVKYDACKAPTIWCSHNDPFYSGTMHGVPCFGMKAMTDFFAGLP